MLNASYIGWLCSDDKASACLLAAAVAKLGVMLLICGVVVVFGMPMDVAVVLFLRVGRATY